MQIIDAQIHTWGSGLPSNLSHRQVTSFTPEEAIALMDEAGVDAAVIHPPGWDPGSTEMALKAVRDFPNRFAIMGSLPLDQPGSAGKIARWRDQRGMLGLRYTFLHEPARQWLADGTIDWLWTEAERAAVPIAMLATDSLADIAGIAHRHPGLRLTIDHLGGRGGLTTLKDAAAMTHIPDLSRWQSARTSPSRQPARPAIPANPTRSRPCTPIFDKSMTHSGRTVCSGEQTSRRCRVPGASA